MAVIVRKLRLLDGGVSSAAKGRFPLQPRLKIAIASQDGRNLDAHFGYARRLMVYEVTPNSHRLVQAIACLPEDAEAGGARDGEDRIGPKVAALACCHLLFVLAIGPPAAARLIKAGIYPVKLDAPQRIEAVVAYAQSMMTGDSATWLRRILGQRQQTVSKQLLRRE
jgi:nitrogen fixation protein NifX